YLLLLLRVSHPSRLQFFHIFFFFHDPPPTAIYTLSLHDALPISITISRPAQTAGELVSAAANKREFQGQEHGIPVYWPLRSLIRDRKSTRLNSSHRTISYAVFCLKKKKKKITQKNKKVKEQSKMV